ncbi:hypothetical protein EGM51_10705 [Verrucomicrobia bacterium S94]|nr:hypothetical protein EGM51_10705 [Verrucomicrobia bacterium S94]
MSKTKTDLKLSPPEYRGELIKRGMTVSGWARKHGYRPTTVFEAIKGNRHGKISKQIINKINREVDA